MDPKIFAGVIGAAGLVFVIFSKPLGIRAGGFWQRMGTPHAQPQFYRIGFTVCGFLLIVFGALVALDLIKLRQ